MKLSPRRIAISMALLVAMLIVLAGSSTREQGADIPVPPATATAAGDVVQGSLPADGTVRAREGDVVRITVQAPQSDVAEIPALAVRTPVGPGLDVPLEVVADQPGRFGVVLRYSGERVGELVVAPAG